MTDRLLHTLLAAGIPADKATGGQGNVVVTYQPWATQPQQDAGAAIVAAFDWSKSAHDAWMIEQAKSACVSALSGPSPLGQLVRALVPMIVDELNILRGQIIGVATAAWNPASIANGAGLTSPNVAVTGAAFGDAVDICNPINLSGLTATGYVVSAGNVAVRLHNGTGGAVDLANGTWTVVVRRHTSLAPRTIAQAKAMLAGKVTSAEGE